MTLGRGTDVDQSGRPRTGRLVFVIAMLLATLLRLWLTGDEDVTARYASYDDLWFIRSAEVGYWGGEKYTHMSAMRPPGYPLWLWAGMKLHVPQRIAIEATYLASVLFLAFALRRAGMSRLWTFLTFTVIAFCAEPLRLFRLIQSDASSVPLMTAFCAALMLVCTTARPVLWGLLAGAIGGIFALTRGEGDVLATFAVAVTGGLLFARGLLAKGGMRAAAWQGIRGAMPAMIALLVVTHAVRCANYVQFGFYATSELSAPGFAGMMKALTRIAPEKPIDYAMISRESMARAYEVSPTFRELQPWLNGKVGQRWHAITKLQRPSLPEGEILSGHPHYAIREAAQAAGKYTSGAEIDAFYGRIADEINAAIDSGAIRGRRVFNSYMDPQTHLWLARLPSSFYKVFRSTFALRPPIEPLMDSVDVNATIEELFDRVCHRRRDLRGSAVAVLSGDVSASQPPKEIRLLNQGGIATLAAAPLSGPGVAKGSQYTSSFSLEVPRANAGLSVHWQVVLADDTTHRYAGRLPAKPQTYVLAGSKSPPRLSIKKIDYALPEPSQRLLMRRQLTAVSHYIIPTLVYAGLAIGVVALIIRRRRVDGAWVTCVLLLALAVLSRFGIFAIIDACSWHGDQPRYIFPAVPAMLACSMLLVSGGLREIRAVFRPASQARSASELAGQINV